MGPDTKAIIKSVAIASFYLAVNVLILLLKG